MSMEVKKLLFDIKGDDRGSLVALEELKNIPFEIKRVYYITYTQSDVVRGHHAHKNLKQILLCVRGSCKIGLDNGKEKEEVLLDKINEGLYLESNIWRTMYDFSEDAVLLVLASELYDESDYIRDYDAFLEYVNNTNGGN